MARPSQSRVNTKRRGCRFPALCRCSRKPARELQRRQRCDRSSIAFLSLSSSARRAVPSFRSQSGSCFGGGLSGADFSGRLRAASTSQMTARAAKGSASASTIPAVPKWCPAKPARKSHMTTLTIPARTRGTIFHAPRSVTRIAATRSAMIQSMAVAACQMLA